MNYEDRVTKEYVEGLMEGMPKIETGSYVGTGTYGEANPTSITFSFVPKIVIVTRETSMGLTPWGGSSNPPGWFDGFMWVTGQAYFQSNCENKSDRINVTLTGTTLSWYSNVNAGHQRNATNNLNNTYNWIAIG